MVTFSEITEKECVEDSYLPLERKLTIRLVQHCAAISAIAELLLYFEMVLCSVVDALCFAA